MIRWPGVIKPGTVINDIGTHEYLLTTFLAAAGDSAVTQDLLKGRKIGNVKYEAHLDRYDLGPALRGESEWPRHEFIYPARSPEASTWIASWRREPRHSATEAAV